MIQIGTEGVVHQAPTIGFAKQDQRRFATLVMNYHKRWSISDRWDLVVQNSKVQQKEVCALIEDRVGMEHVYDVYSVKLYDNEVASALARIAYKQTTKVLQ